MFETTRAREATFGLPLMACIGMMLVPHELCADAFCADTNASFRIMSVNVHAVEIPVLPTGANCLAQLIIPLPWAGTIPIPTTEPISDEAIDVECFYGIDNYERMNLIAEAIKRVDPDVVVITDAFDDDTKWELEYALTSAGGGTYNHRITELDAGSVTIPPAIPIAKLEDSGMMFFSKHPLISFTNIYHSGDDVDIDGWSNGELSGTGGYFVAYSFYSNGQLDGHDKKAAKAAAMVRVQTGVGDAGQPCPVNIAFTHLTADGKSDLDKQNLRRNALLDAARAVITQTLTETQLQTEPVFFAGDFNLNGNLNPAKPPFVCVRPACETDMAFIPARAGAQPPGGSFRTIPWEEVFDNSYNNSNAFYSCKEKGFKPNTTCAYQPSSRRNSLFTDPWAFEHPGGMNGPTGPTGSLLVPAADFTTTSGRTSRIDYILHNQPTTITSNLDDATGLWLTLQHMRVLPWNDPVAFPNPWSGDNVALGYHPLSDHNMVVADYSATRDFQYSTPRQKTDAQGLPYGDSINGPNHGAYWVRWPQSSADCGPWPACKKDFVYNSFTLGFGKNYRWFYVDEKGTFEPFVPAAYADGGADDLIIDVYERNNLSTPIEDYHNLTQTYDEIPGPDKILYKAPTYVLTNPPYYVRISQRDRSLTPPTGIKLIFRKPSCTDPFTDACYLVSSKNLPVTWLGDVEQPLPLASNNYALDDVKYFIFGYPYVPGTQNPLVNFKVTVEGLTRYQDFSDAVDPTNLNIRTPLVNIGGVDLGVGASIFEADPTKYNTNYPDCLSGCPATKNKIVRLLSDGSDPFTWNPTSPNPGWSMTTIGWPPVNAMQTTLLTNNDQNAVFTQPASGYKQYVLRLKRFRPGAQANMWIMLDVGVSTVKGVELYAEKTDDPNSEDEIWLDLGTDGGVNSCGDLPWSINYFESDIVQHAPPLSLTTNADMQGRFVNTAHFKMCEDDNEAGGDDEYGDVIFNRLDAAGDPIDTTDHNVYPNGVIEGQFCELAAPGQCQADTDWGIILGVEIQPEALSESIQ